MSGSVLIRQYMVNGCVGGVREFHMCSGVCQQGRLVLDEIVCSYRLLVYY